MGKRKKAPTTHSPESVEAVTLSTDERERIAALIDGEKSPSPGVQAHPRKDAGARSIEDEARQSELRFESKRDPFERVSDDEAEHKTVELLDHLVSDDNALDSFLTEDEKEAPFAAALTGDKLARELYDGDPNVLGPNAVDDGLYHDRADYEIVEVNPLWMDRLRTMAKEDGVDPIDYVERLIRRQWVSRPLGGKVKR